MCSPFFVYHSVVFQYLAETHLCPVCDMISLTFVLPASRLQLQHSVRLGTAGFSMSGKKGTDIEALGLLTSAVLCRLIYFHLQFVPRRNPWVCCSWWSPYSVSTSGVGWVASCPLDDRCLSKCSTVSFLRFTKNLTIGFDWSEFCYISAIMAMSSALLHANCKHAMWTE